MIISIGQIGLGLDFVAGLLFVWGLVTLREKDLAQLGDPSFDDDRYEGIVLGKQDATAGAWFFSAASLFQLLGSFWNGSKTLNWVILAIAVSTVLAYLSARTSLSEGQIVRLRLRHQGRAMKQVTSRAIAMAIALG